MQSRAAERAANHAPSRLPESVEQRGLGPPSGSRTWSFTIFGPGPVRAPPPRRGAISDSQKV